MEKQPRAEKNKAQSIINTVNILPQKRQQSFSWHSLHSVGMLPDLSDLSGGCLSTGPGLSFQTHILNSTGKVWCIQFIIWISNFKKKMF